MKTKRAEKQLEFLREWDGLRCYAPSTKGKPELWHTMTRSPTTMQLRAASKLHRRRLIVAIIWGRTDTESNKHIFNRWNTSNTWAELDPDLSFSFQDRLGETKRIYLTHGSRQTLLQSSRIAIGNSIANACKLGHQIETSSDATRLWELPDDI